MVFGFCAMASSITCTTATKVIENLYGMAEDDIDSAELEEPIRAGFEALDGGSITSQSARRHLYTGEKPRRVVRKLTWKSERAGGPVEKHASPRRGCFVVQGRPSTT